MTAAQLATSSHPFDVSWHRLAEVAASLGALGRERARLADLTIARAVAESRELLPAVFGRATTSVPQLKQALSEIAAFELPSLSDDGLIWRDLTEAAAIAGEQIVDVRALHGWSATSQGSDSGRKGKGAYCTPPVLAVELVQKTLEPLTRTTYPPSICDPSAGHGALLIAALDFLVACGYQPEDACAALYGVELDPHARELSSLMLWLAACGVGGRANLEEVRQRVVLGNALRGRLAGDQVSDGQVSLFGSARAEPPLTWDRCFTTVFAGGGFDVVIMNPPWESLRHKLPRDTEGWVERNETHSRLSTTLGLGRGGLPPLFTRQGRGDRNLYKGFVELAPHLLRDGGRVGALLPGAFASDLGTQPLRELYLEHMAIEQWTSFENLENFFPIDSRYKFGVLIARRSPAGTERMRVRFLSRCAAEIRSPHIELKRADIDKLGGSAKMFPEVSNDFELGVLRRAFRTGSSFFDPEGSFGPIHYKRELDLTLGRKAGLFRHVDACLSDGYVAGPDGSWTLNEQSLVPLIEGRMVGAFDFFQKSWRAGAGRTARWTENGSASLAGCQPQFLAERTEAEKPRIAICDVTSATNTRTMLAAWVPPWPCGNTAPVLLLDDAEASLALLAVLNSMTFDWILRRIVAGLHLNRFYLDATPLPQIDAAQRERLARFAAAVTSSSARVASLSHSDRAGLPPVSRDDCGMTDAEVEATVARGYGLTPEQLEHVLSRDERERKGLWRYYAAAPEAARIAEESLRLLRAA